MFLSSGQVVVKLLNKSSFYVQSSYKKNKIRNVLQNKCKINQTNENPTIVNQVTAAEFTHLTHTHTRTHTQNEHTIIVKSFHC